ncbi:HAD-IIA family hydrolase [Aquipuribacter nitratireducens]|uniref:HAD-IIA family hydrolase n=1 Tax=Aquipuribacter nitratireducens TaxID=650104 RepID=A0ABW0GP65_9MICO
MTGPLDGTLMGRHDALLLDLDGVVYEDDHPVAGAVAAIEAVRAAGVPVRFVTNNASRTPAQVADRLRRLGVPAEPEEVLGSAQAAAHLLAGRDDVPDGASVGVVGGEGLLAALRDVGLDPALARDLDAAPSALVQGFSPDLGWLDLAAGTRWVREGVLWVATNLDLTYPSSLGIAPGNGLMVHAVATAAGRRPDAVAGKPLPHLFRTAAEAAAARSPLVVGDRLDTDLAGAVAAGHTGALVLTGVHGVDDALAAEVDERPHVLLRDLGELVDPAALARVDERTAVLRQAWADSGATPEARERLDRSLGT